MLHCTKQFAYLQFVIQERETGSFVCDDADEEGKPEAKVDVKHVGADSI